MSEAVLVDRREHVVVLTINRPEARNAVDLAVTVALGDALEAADADPDVRAVVLTGAGDRAFCAGADLKALARGERTTPDDPVRAAWGFAGVVSHPIGTPVIAAVNGAALGGGTELVLASDLVVAAASATLGLPEVTRGLIARAGGAFRLVHQLPQKVAMEFLLTGRPMTSARALELGLVNRVVPDGDVLTEALALAAVICANAPLAVQATKRVALGICDGRVPGDVTGWERTFAEARDVWSSADAQEGPRAFAEKRAPVWTGR